MSSRILRLLTLTLLFPLVVQAQALQVDKRTLWQGVVELKGPVVVTSAGVLQIAAGTRVKVLDPLHTLSIQGTLLVEGTAAKPVVFDSVNGWQGISFVEAAAGSRIEHAHFRNCGQALGVIATSPVISESRFVNCEAAIKLLRESSAEILNNHFIDNGVGLGIEMRSSPRVVGNHFSGHKNSGIIASNSSRGLIENNHFEKNDQGIGLLQQYPDKVVNNRFIANRVGLYCYQSQNTPLVENNLFRDNEYGMVNFSFSFPSIRNNQFIGNKTALQNDQFGSAQVEKNLFEGNGTAIYNNRKSNPQIHLNSFSMNKLGLFIDYSSYPEVSQNNFEKTEEGARLGIYQSADWEKRSGSKKLVMKNAEARGSKNTMLGQAPTQYTDVVDLSRNWWGEKTAQLNAATKNQNLSFFYDRRDQPRVTYEGFGSESYQLDEIRFLPVLIQPVADTGPGK